MTDAPPLRIVLLGPPGSGKGTQAAALSERLDLPVISSGDLLRDLAEQDSVQGKALAELIARGELVPDDFVIGVVDEAVQGAPGGYILDGFPRTVAQAERSTALPVDVVVLIDLSDDGVRERIAARRRTEDRTDDADRATTERRIAEYHDETEPLIEFFRGEGILRVVDGAQTPAEVTEAILGKLV